MLFQNITIVDDKFQVRKHMNVGVKGDTVAWVSEQLPAEDYGEVYKGDGKLLIPAFYNAHSHLSMFPMRGYGENLPLMTWLTTRIFPFEAQLTPEDMYYGALMGVAEMLRYGIAGTTDMYLNFDAQARAAVDGGIKANYACCVTCPDDVDYRSLPVYRDALESLKKYHNYDNGRIRTMFSLHAEYTNSERVARTLAEVCAENGSTMHVHVSETAGEVEMSRQNHGGRSPVKFLADCGIFNTPTVAAHCVHVDDEDIAILKEYKVTVGTCPKSNAKLSSGICPVTKLLDAGVNVAIGTDSVSSNNNLNMIEEMRFFNLLQKVTTLDPTAITPEQTLYAATRAGALGQQRDDCGFIKEGFKADLTVFDIDKVYMKPEYNLLNNLVYAADGGDVVLTMVDGRVLYRDGEYPALDVERIEFECEKTRRRIVGEMN